MTKTPNLLVFEKRSENRLSIILDSGRPKPIFCNFCKKICNIRKEILFFHCIPRDNLYCKIQFSR